MWAFCWRRVLWTLPTLLLAITVGFLLLHASSCKPLDTESSLSAAMFANFQAKHHLDQPLWKQYLLYLNSLIHGDLGESLRYADWSVNALMRQALPVSLTVGGVSMLTSIVLGTSLGMLAALHHNSRADYWLMAVSNVGSAFPVFVTGPILILVFASLLDWLPAGGWDDFQIRYMLLPIMLLTIINVAPIGRVARAGLLEVLNTDYIRMACAKGLSRRTVVLRHALRPTLIPVVSVLGPLMINGITSAIVTESVFSLPGLGQLVIHGAAHRDYMLVLGLVVMVTLVAVFLNLLVDLAYGLLDPQIRY